MKKQLLFTIGFLLSVQTISAQKLSYYIQDRAIKIDKPDSLNDEIYNKLSSQQVIMVGEMHGTNEPAKFVGALAKLFTSKGDSVQVGFEIPSSQMKNYLEEKTDASIYASRFFSDTSVDGRANSAWMQVITALNHNAKAEIFFFDENEYNEQRDSIMYLNIRKRILQHTAWKTITLTGNIHNMLLPYKGKNKTAGYLFSDRLLNLEDKICSLNHAYGKGTMLNNTGKGLEVHEADNTFSDFCKAVDYDAYLFLYPAIYDAQYTGIFFTRVVTAATMTGK